MNGVLVQINYCEDSHFHPGSLQKLSELDGTVSRFDAELSAKVDSKTGNLEKTVRMYFTLYYPDGRQMKKLQGKINIGEGTGGIIGQLKAQNEMKLTDESWLEHQKSKGAEEYQAYLADLTEMREHVLPYLQSFCSTEERMPDRINDAEKSLVAEGKGSIHERLKINKEIIAKQQGKGHEGKGF